MSHSVVTLRAARAEDLPWLVVLEQSPGNAPFLCAWPAERHRSALADPGKSYLVCETASGLRCGFAILAGLRSATRAIELVRVAVDPPGQGLGRAVFDSLIRHVFAELAATRLFLDVFDDNARARRVYRRHGFEEEEILPHAARRQDGTRATLVVMAMSAATARALHPW